MELLVVMLIICILAALVFPIVGSIRKKADSAKCISHLRQFGLSFQQYLNEAGDRIVPVAWASGSQQEEFGLPYSGGFLDYFHDSLGLDFKHVSGCPTQRRNKKPIWEASGYNQPIEQRRTYGFNEYATHRDGRAEPTPLISYTEAHGTLIFADGNNSDGGGTAPYYNSTLNPYRLPEAVHDGFANALFLDGHVEAVPEDRLPTADQAAVPGSRERNFWYGLSE